MVPGEGGDQIRPLLAEEAGVVVSGDIIRDVGDDGGGGRSVAGGSEGQAALERVEAGARLRMN